MAGKSQRNITDIFVAAAVVIVIAMIIIPLPTILLDTLMAVNVLGSVLVLLLVIFSSRAIDFSSFPTVLLIITVYGLGLNVSSTRHILADGMKFDGKMVKAFANFVVGSSDTKGLVVGLVIFIIIIAVQAFVITKGATRVAEVAARFTLDAMPQKQMAAEQEYNSGVITEEELKQKKLDIQREADFYGNMDGASKFVSGNVKVGIFITIINIVAGLIIGVGIGTEDFSSAVGVYTRFTIGDGLLSQLPSLLISFATGLIVTRSASEQGATLGTDIKKQFSQSSLVYYVGGAVMLLIGVLPGFPWYVLIPLGAFLFYIGWRLGMLNKKAATAKAQEKGVQKASASASPQTPAATSPIAPLDPLSLELGYVLIPLVDKDKGAELLERITRMRQEAALDLGLAVPSIRIIDNISLDPSEYSFKIKGVEVGRGKIRMGCYMCMNAGGVVKELQGDPTRDPAFGLPAIWVPEKRREEAERAGYAVVDPPTIIATHLTELIKRHASEILGRQEVKAILDALEKDYPAVIKEAQEKFSLGEIQKVMQGLLVEQVSVRNMVVILETMLDYADVTKKTDVLVERVREALGRQICLQYVDTDNNDVHTLKVLTVEPSFLTKLLESRVETTTGPIAALDPALQREWIVALSGTIASVREKGFMPVIMSPSETRLLVKKSAEREIPNLVVISVSEIATDIHVEMLGEIKVGN
ncbi:MAG: flagellar biosynthesis protein FlhA [Spirochaetaceae bacterium]|nr:flagellar biosynthesis protein FlhA [Spirochaetaceae bacterium]